MVAVVIPGPNRTILPAAPAGVQLWLVISTCLVAAGWILSAFGQLNALGYSVVAVITAVLCWRLRDRGVPRGRILSRLKRFRRPLPMLFLVLAACAVAGGMLYAPANWDALAYRTPRVLNWLDAEKWHWIHTTTPRMNVRATGFEWLTAPLILLTKTDRALFIINLISFVLLPGLIFSVFTRIGVRPRVAWYWMWLLPGGYVFALQAGSIGNDAFAAVYALAAVDFALRGQVTNRFRDYALSLLAAGLLTGAKATNIPLILPWLIASVPLIIRWLRQKPLLSAATAAVAALVSFLPLAVLNQVYSNDWTGVKLESTVVPNLTVKEPLVGVAGNGLLLLLHNVIPPFFPFAQWYNQRLMDSVPASVFQTITDNFNSIGIFKLSELPSEDGVCTMGFGTTVLLLISLVVAARTCMRLGSTPFMSRWQQIAFCAAPFIGLCVVLARSGFACSRLIAAFYPFLFGSMLVFVGHRYVISRRWWSLAANLMMVVSVLVIVLTPTRPLLPVRTALKTLGQRFPGNRLVHRADRVYSVYADRADALREIREALPAEVKVIGFASSCNDPEVSLWRPFCTRRVVCIVPGDPPEQLRRLGIQYLVFNDHALKLIHRTTIQEWCQRYDGEIVREWIMPRRASDPDEAWYLVRLTDGPAKSGLPLRAEISETSHNGAKK
jgi:hypothetical protein